MNGIKYRSNGIGADTRAALKKFNELGYTDSNGIIGDYSGYSDGCWLVGFDADPVKWIGTTSEDSVMLEDKEEIFLGDYIKRETELKLVSVKNQVAEFVGNSCDGTRIMVMQDLEVIEGNSLPLSLIVTIKAKK